MNLHYSQTCQLVRWIKSEMALELYEFTLLSNIISSTFRSVTLALELYEFTLLSNEGYGNNVDPLRFGTI